MNCKEFEFFFFQTIPRTVPVPLCPDLLASAVTLGDDHQAAANLLLGALQDVDILVSWQQWEGKIQRMRESVSVFVGLHFKLSN